MSHEAAPENHTCEWEGCEAQATCCVNGRYWCLEHLHDGMEKSLPALSAFKEIFGNEKH